MTLENGFFGDMATIKSAFVCTFSIAEFNKNNKIQGLDCRFDVVKQKFYSSSY